MKFVHHINLLHVEMKSFVLIKLINLCESTPHFHNCLIAGNHIEESGFKIALKMEILDYRQFSNTVRNKTNLYQNIRKNAISILP